MKYFSSSSDAIKRDPPTDSRTDRPTDGQTDQPSGLFGHAHAKTKSRKLPVLDMLRLWKSLCGRNRNQCVVQLTSKFASFLFPDVMKK